MTKKLLIAGLALLVVGGGLWYWLANPKTQLANFNEAGVVLNYPQAFQTAPISAAEHEQDLVLLRLIGAQNMPTLAATLRYEKGLAAVAAITKTPILDLLLSNSNRSFSTNFEAYQKLSEVRRDQFGHQAAEILFTYKVEGQDFKQRFMIVVKDTDSAYYLAARAPVADFDELNNKYFEPMFASLRFNDAAN